MTEREMVIIGGGAGGLVVASVAAQLGLKVTLIEKEAKLGGDCVHQVCFPQSDAAIQEQRIEGHRPPFGDAARRSMGQFVWFADDESVKGEARITRGTGYKVLSRRLRGGSGCGGVFLHFFQQFCGIGFPGGALRRVRCDAEIDAAYTFSKCTQLK